MKKKVVIILSIAIIFLAITGAFILIKNKNIWFDNSKLIYNYLVIVNQEKEKGKKYFLYSNEDKIYYLDGINPKNVIIVNSNINEVNNEIYKQAEEFVKKGEKSFVYNNNRIELEPVIFSAYNFSPHISILKEKLDIIEEKKEKLDYKFDSITPNKNVNDELYYSDKYGRNIYIKGISEIFVIYNNKKYELREVLKENDSLADDVFYFIKKKSGNCSSSYPKDIEPHVLDGYTIENLRITQNYENDTLFYILKYWDDN